MLQKLIEKLTADLELPPLPPKDDAGLFHLMLHPELVISIKELDPGASFSAKIGPCPLKKREEFFILLMKANFLGQGAGGAVIGIDEDEKFLTLSLTLPYDMNDKGFKERIEDFANFVDYWKQELTLHNKEAEKGLL